VPDISKMWQSNSKDDLAIEVWEALDCESIGSRELQAIEKEIEDRFGLGAVDLPMRIARRLADEGAILRHNEILALDVERRKATPLEHFLTTIFTSQTIRDTHISIRRIDLLRRRLEAENDRLDLAAVRKTAIEAKERCRSVATDTKANRARRAEAAEAAEWLRIWLESPEIFEHWAALRIESKDFIDRFGPTKSKDSNTGHADHA